MYLPATTGIPAPRTAHPRFCLVIGARKRPQDAPTDLTAALHRKPERGVFVGRGQVTAAAAQMSVSGVGGEEKAREEGAALQEQLSGGGANHAALVRRTTAAPLHPACSDISLQHTSVPLARSGPQTLVPAQVHRAADRLCGRLGACSGGEAATKVGQLAAVQVPCDEIPLRFWWLSVESRVEAKSWLRDRLWCDA